MILFLGLGIYMHSLELWRLEDAKEGRVTEADKGQT